VPPGKEGKIELAVEHTDGYSGEVAKSASVSTNDPKNATFNLILRARFKFEPPPAAPPAPAPKHVGVFSVEPADRWITSVLSGSNAASTLYLYNDKDTPVRIKQIVLPGSEFTAKFAPIQDGKRYELQLATNPSLKPGYYKQTLKVITDSASDPEVPIDLELNVYPKVFAQPTSIIIGTLPSTPELTSMNWPPITIRKVRDGGLQIKSFKCNLDFIKLALSTEAEGQLYTLKITADQSKVKPGPFKGVIRVETNDPDAPVLEIPVSGSFK